jgi:hypothetical protein
MKDHVINNIPVSPEAGLNLWTEEVFATRMTTGSVTSALHVIKDIINRQTGRVRFGVTHHSVCG